jgi:ElaB/YqjD/DUF883 family membrane-anchored ribosome-binding protein
MRQLPAHAAAIGENRPIHLLLASNDQARPGTTFAGTDASVFELEDSMATVTKSAANVIKEYAEPLRAAVDENMRDVRQAITTGRRAVEDCTDEAVSQVGRHPFMSLGVAVGAGMVLGCVFGFTIGRFSRRRAAR